jgi:hypothetical protein
VGPKERIQERLQAWIAAGKQHQVGTMILNTTDPRALRVVAETVLGAT